jgi:hypothetical protein
VHVLVQPCRRLAGLFKTKAEFLKSISNNKVKGFLPRFLGFHLLNYLHVLSPLKWKLFVPFRTSMWAFWRVHRGISDRVQWSNVFRPNYVYCLCHTYKYTAYRWSYVLHNLIQHEVLPRPLDRLNKSCSGRTSSSRQPPSPSSIQFLSIGTS